MPKEYWVNVYTAYGQQWYGQCFKDKESVENLLAMATQVAYRIHVKMKKVEPNYMKPNYPEKQSLKHNIWC